MLVLGVLLVAADRGGAAVAERVLADELQRGGAMPTRPEVDVRGVPFLTQALAGRYDRVDVVAREVPAGDVAGTPLTVRRLSATLHGAHLPLADALSGTVTSVPVERVDARALLPFDVVSSSSTVSDLEVGAEDGLLRLSGTVRVLGQDITGSAQPRRHGRPGRRQRGVLRRRREAHEPAADARPGRALRRARGGGRAAVRPAARGRGGAGRRARRHGAGRRRRPVGAVSPRSASRAGGTLGAMQPSVALVKRRSVDFCRTGSCLCPSR